MRREGPTPLRAARSPRTRSRCGRSCSHSRHCRFKVIKEANTQSSDIATAFPPVEAKVDVSASAWNDLRAQAEADELRT